MKHTLQRSLVKLNMLVVAGASTLVIGLGTARAAEDIAFSSNTPLTFTDTQTYANGTLNRLGDGVGTVVIFDSGANYTFTGNLMLNGGAWNRLTLNSGAVLNVASNLGVVVSGVSLNGGTLTTGALLLEDNPNWAGTLWDGKQTIEYGDSVINGATIVANQSNASFITMGTGGFSVNWFQIGGDGVVFDSNGYDIGITMNMWGAGRLVKNGEGTLTLTGGNNYSGGTLVNGGKLLLTGSGGGWARIQGVLTVADGATVETSDDGTGLGWQGQISAVTNAGTITSPGTMHVWNISGGMTLDGGTLQSNNGDSNPNGPQLEWDWVSVKTLTNEAASVIAGRIRIRADGNYAGITFYVADGGAVTDLLVSAALTEANAGRSITKTGAGTMALSGQYLLTGPIAAEAGTLRIENTSVLGAAATVKVTSGAWLDLAFAGTNTIDSLFLDGVDLPPGLYAADTAPTFVVGTGCLRISPADDGLWAAASDGNWSVAGNWLDSVIANGKGAVATFGGATGLNVTLDSARNLGGLVFSNANYTIGGSSPLTLQVFGTVRPSIDVEAGRTAAVNVALAGEQGMKKTGDGRLTLTAYNTYNGGTTVNAGTLEVAGANSGWGLLRGAVTVNPGATLAITGGDGTGFGWNSPVTSLAINGGTAMAGSSHIGFGSYANVTMTNGAAISGFWNWNGDSLLGFSSWGDRTNIISGSLTLRSDAGENHTFAVADGASDIDLLVSANLTDQYPEVGWLPASKLTKTGPGTMVFSGTASYDGETFVNDGALYVNGTGVNNVTVAAGKTLGGAGTISGVLTLGTGTVIDPGASPLKTGTLTLNTAPTLSGMTLKVDATATGASDTLVVTGDVSLTGLTIDCLGAALNPTKTYTLMTSTGAITGVPTLLGPSYPWRLAVEGNALVLNFRGTLIRFY
jgi:autotransporter-associated beta strand protein